MRHFHPSFVFYLVIYLHPCLAATTIPYPPTMQRQPSHEQLFHVSQTPGKPDRPFVLECEALGNPEPTYQWSKNGMNFDYEAEGDRIITQPNKGTLYVNKPLDSDEGLYQCFAKNILGVSVSNTVRVRKSDAPYWITAPNNTNATEGETVRFECVAGGIPTPRVAWFMNAIPLKHAKPNHRRTVDKAANALVIDGLEKSDTAVYQCDAYNFHGHALRDFYLNVLVRLEEPKNLKLLYMLMDGRSAKISWDPVNSESVRGYKIQTWTDEEGEEQLREEVVPANVTQHLVTILKPLTRNYVRVLAFNDKYDGPPSDPMYFFTPEGAPGPVAYFDAIPFGSTALYLIWKPPTEPHGVLTGYNIYYREVIGTELGEVKARTPQITDPRETRAKLGGLKPKTKYRIDIYATSSKGQGEKMSIEAQTNDQAEQKPDEPNFVWTRLPDVDGKAGVRVTWVPAVEGHPGTHFFVQYRKEGETTWESSPPEENQDFILVQGLELGSLYEMKVVAVDGPFQTSSKIEVI